MLTYSSWSIEYFWFTIFSSSHLEILHININITTGARSIATNCLSFSCDNPRTIKLGTYILDILVSIYVPDKIRVLIIS